MEYGDYAFGEGGLDIRLSPAGQLQGVSTPTVDRQHDLYFDDPLNDCWFFRNCRDNGQVEAIFA